MTSTTIHVALQVDRMGGSGVARMARKGPKGGGNQRPNLLKMTQAREAEWQTREQIRLKAKEDELARRREQLNLHEAAIKRKEQELKFCEAALKNKKDAVEPSSGRDRKGKQQRYT